MTRGSTRSTSGEPSRQGPSRTPWSRLPPSQDGCPHPPHTGAPRSTRSSRCLGGPPTPHCGSCLPAWPSPLLKGAEGPAYTSDRDESYLLQYVLLEGALQAQYRFGVELRHARFGDAEDLADLAQRQVLVVVERDDELLALGQARDRVREAVLHLGGVHRRRRIDRVGVLDRVEQRDLVPRRVGQRPEFVKGHDRTI